MIPSAKPNPLTSGLLCPFHVRFVDMYADDDKLFFKDFAKAFSTLLELGTHDLYDPKKGKKA